jgi:hypothetical protein
MLGGISYEPDGVLDPRPQAGSPVYEDVLPGAPMEVNYRGAFSGPEDNWADGWTALSQYGYLKPAQETPGKPVIAVTEDIASGTEVTWTADNEYLLQTMIYVQTNATLIIEPGTVIKGCDRRAGGVATAGHSGVDLRVVGVAGRQTDSRWHARAADHLHGRRGRVDREHSADGDGVVGRGGDHGQRGDQQRQARGGQRVGSEVRPV